MRLRILCGLILFGLVSACGRATTSKENQEILNMLKANERAKAELQQQPATFIFGGGWKLDEGILNPAAVYFVNKSEFDVSGIEGRLVYTDASGTEGSVPFQADGDLRAGWAKQLDISAQKKFPAAAIPVKIVVEKVRILGG
jgi:hypothetical protein